MMAGFALPDVMNFTLSQVKLLSAAVVKADLAQARLNLFVARAARAEGKDLEQALESLTPDEW